MKKQIKPKAGETWVTEHGVRVSLTMAVDDTHPLTIETNGTAPCWTGEGVAFAGPISLSYGSLVKREPPINFQRVAARMAKELRLARGDGHAFNHTEAALSIYTKAIKRGKK